MEEKEDVVHHSWQYVYGECTGNKVLSTVAFTSHPTFPFMPSSIFFHIYDFWFCMNWWIHTHCSTVQRSISHFLAKFYVRSIFFFIYIYIVIGVCFLFPIIFFFIPLSYTVRKYYQEIISLYFLFCWLSSGLEFHEMYSGWINGVDATLL